MLKLMRDSFQHLKWVLVFVIFLFVMLVFVDWGGAGRTGSGVSDLGAAAVRVDGESISIGEYHAPFTTWSDASSRPMASRSTMK